MIMVRMKEEERNRWSQGMTGNVVSGAKEEVQG